MYELRNILDECDGDAEFLVAVKGMYGLNVYEVEKENIAFQPALQEKEVETVKIKLLKYAENY